MVLWEEYSLVENPEVLAIAVGVLIFVILFEALTKIERDRMTSIVVSLISGLIAGWWLYKERFYNWENALAILIYLAIAGIFLRIIWAFVRNIKRNFGRR